MYVWNIKRTISMVSCQKGPTRHAYAWQIGPFWHDILDMCWCFKAGSQLHLTQIYEIILSPEACNNFSVGRMCSGWPLTIRGIESFLTKEVIKYECPVLTLIPGPYLTGRNIHKIINDLWYNSIYISLLSFTPFSLCSHHHIIMNFSAVFTLDRSDVHAKGQGQMSKVKVTEAITQFNGFRTITPVWIHQRLWND